MAPTLKLYPLSNYSFAVKSPQIEEDPSVNARLQRLQTDFELHGMRRTVEGLLVVHEHGHPHILLLQVANAFYKLPGDYLLPTESDVDGLSTRLDRRLGAVEVDPNAITESSATGEGMQVDGTTPAITTVVEEKVIKGTWTVKDCLAQWWRPNFETFMYPYIPAHISNPKEIKSLYLLQLPEKQVLTVPGNMKLLAIPLFELFDNAVRYGPLLAAVPHLLSKYEFTFES